MEQVDERLCDAMWIERGHHTGAGDDGANDVGLVLNGYVKYPLYLDDEIGEVHVLAINLKTAIQHRRRAQQVLNRDVEVRRAAVRPGSDAPDAGCVSGLE